MNNCNPAIYSYNSITMQLVILELEADNLYTVISLFSQMPFAAKFLIFLRHFSLSYPIYGITWPLNADKQKYARRYVYLHAAMANTQREIVFPNQMMRC